MDTRKDNFTVEVILKEYKECLYKLQEELDKNPEVDMKMQMRKIRETHQKIKNAEGRLEKLLLR